MSSEVSRRDFLAFGGAAFVRDRRRTDKERVPWWTHCSTSPDYRCLRQGTAAEGLIIAVSETGPYSLDFIDDDYPILPPVNLPRALARRDIQVVGTVGYEMSLSDAAAWGLGAGSDLVVKFHDPADVTVYADESKYGGIVIVATQAGSRPSDTGNVS
jgi:hypothetical protein